MVCVLLPPIMKCFMRKVLNGWEFLIVMADQISRESIVPVLYLFSTNRCTVANYHVLRLICWNDCRKISRDELKEGDLVFFRTEGGRKKSPNHSGIYLKMANLFIPAPPAGWWWATSEPYHLRTWWLPGGLSNVFLSSLPIDIDALYRFP